MMNHIQDLKRRWTPIKIGVLIVSTIGINIGCTEIDSGWSPGAAPDGGWTVPALYHRAVEDGFTGTALVRYRGDMLLNSAAGFADKEAGTANMTDTVFNIGSITKQYTGALILSLQESGLLKVEDRLSDHFDNVPQDKADITIHQLLTHTAGFAVGLGGDDDPIDREEYLALAWSIPLQGSPGAQFSYSNAGYSIAAAVAETVTGQSYESALVERLFAPAGINETGYVLPDWSGRLIAIGYNESGSLATYWTDRTISIEYSETGSLATQEASWTDEGPYWHLRGNGGLLTTTSDLLKWNDALSGTELLGASGIEVLQGQHAEISGHGSRFYGYGMWATDSPIGSLHWHSGANGFNYAQMLRFVDDDLVVIILSNEDSDVSRYLPMGLARAAATSLVNWHSPFDN
ncbi:MAG: serine hydrolase domain-containing protein [Granulosicoccus sp.]